MVLYCIDKNTSIDKLSLEELKSIHPIFEEDIFDAVSLKTCVEKRLTIGAPGREAMEKVIALHREYLAKEEDYLPGSENYNIVTEEPDTSAPGWWQQI